MFSFNSLRCNWARSVFALLAVAFLSTTLLFTGCKTEADDDDPYKINSKFRGTWIDGPNYGSYDGYVITATKLSYVSGTDPANLSVKYRGTIKHVTEFTANSGVIIMSYDNGFENKYYHSTHWDSYPAPCPDEPCVEEPSPNGNFIGIYYKNLVPGVSADIATAYLSGGAAEQATLNAANAAYTELNGDPGTLYIYSYGTYNKQP